MHIIYFYITDTINHHWDFLPTLDEISNKLISKLKESSVASQSDIIAEINYLLAMKRQLASTLLAACKATPFDGYFEQEPKVFLYPVAGNYFTGFKMAFIWSQEHTKLTYIAANHVLPWQLDEHKLIVYSVS